MNNKLLVMLPLLISTSALAHEQEHDSKRAMNITNYHESIKFDRMRECINGGKTYSVGITIKTDVGKFKCDKYGVLLGVGRATNEKFPASWKKVD